MNYVHLHVQSAYSLLSSTVDIEGLVSVAKNNGMNSIALTDRNVMYGVIPFYKACKKNGIKPIFGLIADVLHGEEAFPLLLLARNYNGYVNLLKISSSIQVKSKQGLPLKWLRGYREGLIAISPGREGIIETLLLSGEKMEAKEMLQTFQMIFGSDNFYLSIQPHGQQDVSIREFASETGTAVVATNPVSFLKPEDALAYNVLKAVQSGTKLTDEQILEKQPNDYVLKSSDEMIRIFSDMPDFIRNSEKIAAQCNVEIPFHQQLLPKYPTRERAGDLLQQLCEEGMKRRYGEHVTQDHRQRLHYELSVIQKMNFSDYFLIVWDFMKFAKQKKILTGPGRGSAAGSLVAYVLEITDIDPIEHNLLFERFLNPERVSMPDIDIDFSDIRRDEVIAYVAEKYGELHVAQIITFGTFAAKAALRDTGRVFGLNSKELDRLSKMIPNRLGITIREALQESKQLQEYYSSSDRTKKLIDTSMKIEGLPRHTSTHAAGVIICNQQLTETIAIQEGHNGVLLTQFPMEALEELGLLKMDFLGLRNLTLMERVLFSIKKETGKVIDLQSIPMNDEKTMLMFGKGETIGVFQFESEGMQKVLRELKPEKFSDLVAVNALYRPGPMENIPSFIRRRHGEEKVTYLHEDLKGILESTYGIIVYQEQIIQIASKFAGFSLGQADLLRRAVSKKNAVVLEEQRQHFVRGSLKQGYPQQIAEQIYNYIVKFANYGFNLSHAAAYSLIAYQLGYLKANYPRYFMAALMSSVIGNDQKIAQYAREMKKMNLSLLPPSINRSQYTFSPEKEGIRYSLAAIKGVGATAVKEIVQARYEKKFGDLFDFCVRVTSKANNRKTFEALIDSGAFDEWGEDRATLLASLDIAMDHAELVSSGDSYDLFENTGFDLKPKYITAEPISLEDKLLKEKEVLGLYISSHPVMSYKSLFSYFGTTPLYQLKVGNDVKVAVGVYITELKAIRTKKGEIMSFLLIGDDEDEMEAVVFPNVYKQYNQQLEKGKIVMLHGQVEQRNSKNQFVVREVFSIEQLKELQQQSSQMLYVKIVPQQQTKERFLSIKNVLRKYPGTTRVSLYFEKENKAVQLPMWDWVNPTQYLLSDLAQLLGAENVKVR